MIRACAAFLALLLLSTGCSSDQDSEEAKCAEKLAPFHCVSAGCGGDVVKKPTCQDGAWVCSDGWVPPSECPSDACFHPPVYSCCDDQGNRTQPTCPGQAGEACSLGSTLVLNFSAPCPKPDEFVCDYHVICKRETQFCEKHATGGMCQPIPTECASDPTCECVKASSTCFNCEDSGDGEIVITC